MGLFSNLFGKKKGLAEEKAVKPENFEVIVEEKVISTPRNDNKTLVVKEEYPIPQLQGDYAKTVFYGQIKKRLPLRHKKIMLNIFCMNVVLKTLLHIIEI